MSAFVGVHVREREGERKENCTTSPAIFSVIAGVHLKVICTTHLQGAMFVFTLHTLCDVRLTQLIVDDC